MSVSAREHVLTHVGGVATADASFNLGRTTHTPVENCWVRLDESKLQAKYYMQCLLMHHGYMGQFDVANT